MLRHFINISDWSAEEIHANLSFAKELKRQTKLGHCPNFLAQRTYALIFYKKSLRTRISFEVGIYQLGGKSIVLSESDFRLGQREPIPDVAKVMSRYVDGILIRTFKHQDLLDLAEHTTVPIVNMLTDYSHPCQIMADMLTIEEHLETRENLKIAYFGDGNNIVNSWLNMATRIPMDLWVATAPETLPDEKLVEEARAAGISQVTVTHNAEEAAENAHVLYTDVWASMGQKEKAEEQRRYLAPFQIRQELLNRAQSNAIVMHCLPAERGEEITAEVLDGPQSVILDQAENRMHVQKAILVQLEQWRSQNKA